MVRVLKALDFRVIEGLDLDKAGFAAKLREFARASRGAEATLLYYAGHGLQVEGRNYLVPIDARLKEEVDLHLEALDLGAFLGQMRSAVNLVFLDACRDNPLAQGLARSMGASRSAAVGRGLGRVESASGTLIAYATQPGNVAEDGKGRNSPFTEALVQHIATPGLSVNDLLTAVTDSVVTGTAGRQQPWTHSSLRKPFYFKVAAVPPAAPSPSAAAAPAGGLSDRLTADQLAARAYEAAERANTIGAYRLVVDNFPGTFYADLAREHIAKLGRAEQVSTSPATASTETKTDDSSASAPETVEASLGLERLERRRVQEGLTALGFDPGPADGLFGRGTRDAIGKWQISKSAPITGYLDAEVAKTLLAAGEAAARARAERERKAREAAARAEAERKARERAAMRPGRVFRDCEECPEMVVVPAGSFTMGAPSREEGRDSDEGPQHTVTIRAPFAVGKYEVTFLEWDGCVAAGGCGHRADDEGWGRGRRPVMNVSWEDARSYVRWLSGKTGKRYRLLSEAEWEYAARAGTRTRYHWGDRVGRNRANCDGCGSRWDDDRTAPVGSFPANGFGLHDVHGNVWEWVEDCRHDDYAGAPLDGSAWTAGGECGRRVLRGGSWFNVPRNLRSAFRYRGSAGFRNFNLGFRVARTLTP